MASGHQAASGIRKWALSRNLMPALPGDVEATYVVDTVAATFSEEAEVILRQRGIASISFDETNDSVCVYTKRRVTQKDLTIIPNEIFGCEVSYPQGEIEELGTPPVETQGASYSIATVAGRHYYCCGSSISPGNSASAGTLGALLRVGSDIFGITNNHVTGGCSHSPVGLPILAPGILDVGAGGLNPFTIGLHKAILNMVPGDGGHVDIMQNSDAAIFSLVSADAVSSMQGDKYDTPAQILDPAVQMIVEKVGRTTGHTIGKIVGQQLLPIRVNASAPVYDYRATVWFPRAYIVHGETDVFSAAGDSGSLVVTKKLDGTYAAVGLLFAGGPDSKAPGNKRTFILPISAILTRFGATLVSGHNVPPP